MNPPYLIVTDSGPLIMLGVARALDTLLAPGLPVVVPDMVRYQIHRDPGRPGARQAADWIRAHEGLDLRVDTTEVFEEFVLLESIRPGTTPAGRGERAAAEVLRRELVRGEIGAILLVDDSDALRRNFLVRLLPRGNPARWRAHHDPEVNSRQGFAAT